MPLLDRIEIDAQEPARATVIWLHGLGASGDDFAPLVPLLGLPHVRFIFPHAPAMPVTVNGGWVMPAWYDIRSLEPGPDREDVDQLRTSSARILELVQQEQRRGIPSDRIVLAGFSQGGAVVMDMMTRVDTVFRGALVLSSYLVDADGLDTRLSPKNAQSPLWFGHGRHDDVVSIVRGRTAYEAWTGRGRTATWRDYPMAHELCPPELIDLRSVLHDWLDELSKPT